VNQVSFRHVDPQDADALELLHEASIDARALYPELFVGVVRPATNEPLAERSVYVVGYANGKPLVSGAIRPFNSSIAEVRRMYVHRDHRRQGFAREMLKYLRSEAIRLGYSRLIMETGYRQLPAMRLYEAFGFRQIAPFGEYANDPTSVCYELALAADA
jgi:putative acetyltransferase